MALTEAAISQMVAFSPPSLTEAKKEVRSLIRYFDPQYHDTDNISRKTPTIFVGNHSLWSIADFLIPYGIYKSSGIYVRTLGDRMHFSRFSPQRNYMKKRGVVVGDRNVVRALMADQQSILVFPGGGREVMKRHHEKYTLQWKRRTGFIRLALEGKYSITPIGVAGGDDMYDILFDAGDFKKTLFGRLVTNSTLFKKHLRRGEELPPLTRGLAGTMWPKPQQLHFVFGKPIKLAKYRTQIDDDEAMLEAREKIIKSVERLIEKAHLHRRTARKDMSLIRRTAITL